MKDATKQELEAGRPAPDAEELIQFCLDRLYEDRQHRVGDEVVKDLTFEELIGALLQARDELQRLNADVDSLADDPSTP